MKIHILGASGSGTSTLGLRLSEELGVRQFDSDDYFWRKTDPPFTEKNSVSDRHRMLLFDMKGLDGWVLSGSMDSWSEPFEKLFTLVVFLRVPTDVRISRLRQREFRRHGPRIEPGGDMHKPNLEFLDWARQYDQGTIVGRNLKRHETWLAALHCPVLRLDGQLSTETMSNEILNCLRSK